MKTGASPHGDVVRLTPKRRIGRASTRVRALSDTASEHALVNAAMG